MKINDKKEVLGYVLSELKEEPVKGFEVVCKKAAADGSVLLKNDNNILPLINNEKVSIFGRIQIDYYKSGTGSGGLVNVEYKTNILDSLRAKNIQVNEELALVYTNWLKENPFDVGKGWAQEPWCQVEMELDDELVKNAAKNSDVAIVVIGRTAGEDKDNKFEKGSYLLTDLEEDMLKKVSENFEKVVVLLNVGNIIDYSFIEKYNVDSVLCIWHGGQEGGSATADLICGDITPSGKLTDTAVFDITDYPSNSTFGQIEEIVYEEDIYVGYRYFETFAPQKVRYPFGFGLSYTNFEVNTKSVTEKNGVITAIINVKNTGKFKGREVVQVYLGAPQGKLGQPLKQLAAYKKTALLETGEDQDLTIEFKLSDLASYDDGGITGNKSCYVLEAGEYIVYVGTDVRNAKNVFNTKIEELVVIQELSEALAPVKDFKRMKAVEKDGKIEAVFEDVPKRTINLEERIKNNRPVDIEFTGDKGIQLLDVANGKNAMGEFVAQFTDFEMGTMIHGEGMCSPKVTAGTGGCFGGITERLLDFGIPAVCVTDGPSGIRLDSGAKATAMPIGTLLACTWDDELIEELHIYEGLELYAYKVDALLGPGLNIHRHPLNGRNFEYFSEDPLVSGKMAAAICRGIAKSGPTATIKHFISNNQEISRAHGDCVISERAIREIYMRGFEIAVKEGNATAIMTSYNPTNGFWNQGNYDLNTTILREEWGYKGIVMSDWWAKANFEGEEGILGNDMQMVRAQNDVYMVCKDTIANKNNLLEGLKSGYITRGELQRNFINLLEYILRSPAFERYVAGGCVRPVYNALDDSQMKVQFSFEEIKANDVLTMNVNEEGTYVFCLGWSSSQAETSQMVVTMKQEGEEDVVLSVNGTYDATLEQKFKVDLKQGNRKIWFEFGDLVQLRKLEVKI